MGGITTIIQYHVRLPVLCIDTAIDAPPEILLRLAAPGKDRYTRFRQCGGDFILQKERNKQARSESEWVNGNDTCLTVPKHSTCLISRQLAGLVCVGLCVCESVCVNMIQCVSINSQSIRAQPRSVLVWVLRLISGGINVRNIHANFLPPRDKTDICTWTGLWRLELVSEQLLPAAGAGAEVGGAADRPNFGRKQTSIINVASLIAKPLEPPATPFTSPRPASLD